MAFASAVESDDPTFDNVSSSDEDDRDVLELEYELEVVDPAPTTTTFQLGATGASNRLAKTSPPPTAYDEQRNQIVSEGQLLSSRFLGRVKRVIWGYFQSPSNPACLLLLEVNFKPKKYGGFFRYRDAAVEVEVDDGAGHGQKDQDGEDHHRGPHVLKIYPELITGKVKTATEEFGFHLEGNAAPVPISVGGKYSFSGPKEGRSLVHGTVEGQLERSVEWKIRENDITGAGIEPRYTLAAIVANPESRAFNMVVRIRATTMLNVAIKGRGTSPIYFTPTADEGARRPGGLVTYGQRAYAPKPPNAAENEEEDLDRVDLEALTRMQRTLLG